MKGAIRLFLLVASCFLLYPLRMDSKLKHRFQYIADGMVTDALITDIAERASADERSVMRALLALPVRGKAGERIEKVLDEMQTQVMGEYEKGKN